MKLLVTGGNGQLALAIKDALIARQTDIGCIDDCFRTEYTTFASSRDLDITDTSRVDAYFESHDFDCVINCAAFTDVDECEKRQELAFAVNARGAENIARAASRQDMAIVQLSTDYVLQGSDSVPQDENALCNPQTIYGESKLLSEQLVRENCKRHIIIRTAWLYSRHGKNFVRTMLRLAHEKSAVKVVSDQIGSPTNAGDLVYELLKLVLNDDYGTYNCTGKGSCSWYEFACEIMRLSGMDCVVEPCTTDEFPHTAIRPAFSILDNKHIRDTIGDEMREWREALASYVASGL